MNDSYDPGQYPPFAVTADIVVLTIRNQQLCVLVVERAAPPFKGQLALPGGFVRPDESLVEAARRELAEETSVSAAGIHLEQLATYGRPDRDPRMRVITVTYLALVAGLGEPHAGGDAGNAYWQVVEPERQLRWAFDHGEIVADSLERARAKLEYTTLATEFCEPEFTLGELREVYEIVWGSPLDSRNFHRKVMATDGFVEPTGDTTVRAGGRPARLYRRGGETELHPPLVRG